MKENLNRLMNLIDTIDEFDDIVLTLSNKTEFNLKFKYSKKEDGSCSIVILKSDKEEDSEVSFSIDVDRVKHEEGKL